MMQKENTKKNKSKPIDELDGWKPPFLIFYIMV